MESDAFENKMRAGEVFHALRLLPDAWTVLRVDGRSFSRFTETHFDKPFDARFRDFMVTTAHALLQELHGVYAYTESDEISVCFPPDWNLFDREVEKLVSLSASIAGATFSLACGKPAYFDSRIWMGVDAVRVVDYFRWRQSDAARCALNGWCYWTLRQNGASVTQATRQLEGASQSDKNELLFAHGINFNDLPAWQKRGTGLYWETYQKEGFNPITQESVPAQRRRICVNAELPMKDEYAAFLHNLLTSSPLTNVPEEITSSPE